MDSKRLKTPRVGGLPGIQQTQHTLKQPSRFPNHTASINEENIRKRLAQAEQHIRQQRPATALVLLQAPGAPPMDWPRRWHLHWYLLVGWALIQQQQPLAARGILQQGLELFDLLYQQPPSAELVPFEHGEWLRYFLGVSYRQCDQLGLALRCHQQGLLAIIQGAIHDPELTMLLYQGLGHTFLVLGDNAEALVCLTLAREHGQDVYNPYAEGVTEWSLGLAYTKHGDLFRAKRALIHALRCFEQVNALPLVARVRASLGQVLLEQQREGEAEVMLRQALGGAERLGDLQARGEALVSLARFYLARGKPERAIRQIQIGLAILQETPYQSLIGQFYLTLARAYQAQHHQEATEEAFKTAINLLHRTPYGGLIAQVHKCYAQFLADQRRFREAYEQLKLAVQKNIP